MNKEEQRKIDRVVKIEVVDTTHLNVFVIFLMIFTIDYGRRIFSWCFSEHRSDVGKHCQ